MDLSFEQRLLRFLDREEEDERRSSRDLRALSVAERVLEGECIEGAVLRSISEGGFAFELSENLSKFRPGDPLAVGDGIDFGAVCPLVYVDYDAEQHILWLERDRFSNGEALPLSEGASYCIDRRPLGLRGRLQNVVRGGFADPLLREVLEGRHEVRGDAARRDRALERLSGSCLNQAQLTAAAAAIGTESLALIQGPPGTGKTRMLAEVLEALCSAGCRIVLSAFTHRAVDNVLFALRRIAPRLVLVKVGNPGNSAAQLRQAGVRLVNRRRNGLPQGGAVIAGTCFALARLPERERFHFAVFDEAGQLPIPHAIAGMLLARRWIFVGDHRQLPPVITAHHVDDEVKLSIFERLHDLYGSYLLDQTYRMNDQVCEVISRTFYGGRLHPVADVAGRRMPFRSGGFYDEVLDPEKSVVLARVDHSQPGIRSVEEANLIADLIEELISRHAVEPRQVAVIAPFRAQVRQIRSALQRKKLPGPGEIAVDTVERMQGQEREVILISLAVGDPDSLDVRSKFFFSSNRLNVALSRARSKVVLVASSGAFRALPLDADSLRAAAVFKSLYRGLPQVDLTKVYCAT